MTLYLSPELETRLQVAAVRHGQDVNTFGAEALMQVLTFADFESEGRRFLEKPVVHVADLNL